MELACITLQGEGIREIIEIISKKQDVYYEYKTKDVVILLDEEYYMRIESNLMSVYILNFKDERSVEIEMIAGGGNHGSSAWGAETKEIKSITYAIMEICKEKNWEVVEIQPEEFKQSLEKSSAQKFMESIFSRFK